jgi:hypothetical protein
VFEKQFEGLLTGGGFADHRHVGHGAKHQGQALSKHRVIIGKQQAKFWGVAHAQGFQLGQAAERRIDGPATAFCPFSFPVRGRSPSTAYTPRDRFSGRIRFGWG